LNWRDDILKSTPVGIKMSSTNSPRRSSRIAEQQAKMTLPVALRRSTRIAAQQAMTPSSSPLEFTAPRRSPRIAEMNRLAEIKKHLTNRASSQSRITRSRLEVKIDDYLCSFDKHTGTWISEKLDYEIDC
jgi:hypothetical protein